MIIYLVIPAKGTSDRVPGKNLRELHGKSLVRRACERGLAAKLVNRCWLDTESEAIIRECGDLTADGLGLLKRSPELATNKTSGNGLMRWELKALPPCDVLCQTFATAPLLRPETIDRCIREFLEHPACDSFFTVTEVCDYLWTADDKPLNFDNESLPNSQEMKVLYRETHGLYGIRTDALRALGTRIGRKPWLVTIPKLEALDIDDEDDLWMAERLLSSE